MSPGRALEAVKVFILIKVVKNIRDFFFLFLSLYSNFDQYCVLAVRLFVISTVPSPKDPLPLHCCYQWVELAQQLKKSGLRV